MYHCCPKGKEFIFDFLHFSFVDHSLKSLFDHEKPNQALGQGLPNSKVINNQLGSSVIAV